MIYNYTKQVNVSVLNDILKLDDVLRPLITTLNISHNADGSSYTDNVQVHTAAALSTADKDLLDAVFTNYDTHPFIARLAIEDNVMKAAMAFGSEFLAKFSANNIYLGKTSEQINNLLAKYPALIDTCLTGSLTSLYGTVLLMVPDDDISQAEIDEFKKRIELYLGII